MSDAARYAIYLAPPADAPLWHFGSAVLGYDAASGRDIEGFTLPGFDAATWRRITMRPRTYGFHATLKAPFRLAPGRDAEQLQHALHDFAGGQDAFDLGPLGITSLADAAGYGFAALTQKKRSRALEQLEVAVVSHFDAFRAPMTDEERAKRNPDRLSERQKRSLDQFGYPHTGPDFRFHMTLSGDVADVADIAEQLSQEMAKTTGPQRFMVDALVLFCQPAPAAGFTIVCRAPLRGAAPSR